MKKKLWIPFLIMALIGVAVKMPEEVLAEDTAAATAITLMSYSVILFPDGEDSTILYAQLVDADGNPVGAGKPVYFRTTLGTFPNGMDYLDTTTNDFGLVQTALIAGKKAGTAYVTCQADNVSATIAITIATLEYETEPNDTSTQADELCFSHAFVAQMASPYDQDWYRFTVNSSSHITLNFITTAIPADSGCEEGTTTVGTYRVDVRDAAGQVLTSFQNVDCIYNNGNWEVGIGGPGTYYLVVYCPLLKTDNNYLSDPYYLTAFLESYMPCGDFNQDGVVNSLDLVERYEYSKIGFMEWVRSCWMTGHP